MLPQITTIIANLSTNCALVGSRAGLRVSYNIFIQQLLATCTFNEICKVLENSYALLTAKLQVYAS